MESGGGWKNGIRADVFSGRKIRHQFQADDERGGDAVLSNDPLDEAAVDAVRSAGAGDGEGRGLEQCFLRFWKKYKKL